MQSKIRQNFHEDSEKAINDQINLELYASYVYQSLGFYFDRDDVALTGFSKHFLKESQEEREHAQLLMKYLNRRGGKIILQDIKRPEQDEWGNGLNALESSLLLERKVNQSLLELHVLATTHNDAHLSDFLEKELLDTQVESIKQIGDMIAKLKLAGPGGLGLYLFDEHLKS